MITVFSISEILLQTVISQCKFVSTVKDMAQVCKHDTTATGELIHGSQLHTEHHSKVVGHLTCKSEVLGLIPGLATYFGSPSADSRGAVTGESMCMKYWLTA